jgi:hypothetical protein
MILIKNIIDRAIFKEYMKIVPEINALPTIADKNERISIFIQDLFISCKLNKRIGDLELNDDIIELANSILIAKQQEMLLRFLERF